MYHILDGMVDYMFAMLRKLDAKIVSIEEIMFAENMRQIVQDISLTRRDIITLRRVVRPQIAIVSNLERKERPFIQQDMEVYFSDIVEASRAPGTFWRSIARSSRGSVRLRIRCRLIVRTT